MTPTPQQRKLKFARWLHKKGYGCVSPYGTNESAREAYDLLQHQKDATEYFGAPTQDDWPSPGYIDTGGNQGNYGSE